MTEYIITPPPADEDLARAMIAETTCIAAQYLADTTKRFTDPIMNPFNYIGDEDDYRPAAANLLASLTNALHSDDYDNAVDLITALINDEDFIQDAIVCDFSSPITDLIEYDDEL